MAGFNMEEVEEKYADNTVLVVRPRVINQITAEKMVKEEIISTGARLPPANVRYHIIWFRKRLQHHPIRTYIIFDYLQKPKGVITGTLQTWKTPLIVPVANISNTPTVESRVA